MTKADNKWHGVDHYLQRGYLTDIYLLEGKTIDGGKVFATQYNYYDTDWLSSPLEIVRLDTISKTNNAIYSTTESYAVSHITGLFYYYPNGKTWKVTKNSDTSTITWRSDVLNNDDAPLTTLIRDFSSTYPKYTNYVEYGNGRWTLYMKNARISMYNLDWSGRGTVNIYNARRIGWDGEEFEIAYEEIEDTYQYLPDIRATTSNGGTYFSLSVTTTSLSWTSTSKTLSFPTKEDNLLLSKYVKNATKYLVMKVNGRRLGCKITNNKLTFTNTYYVFDNDAEVLSSTQIDTTKDFNTTNVSYYPSFNGYVYYSPSTQEYLFTSYISYSSGDYYYSMPFYTIVDNKIVPSRLLNFKTYTDYTDWVDNNDLTCIFNSSLSYRGSSYNSGKVQPVFEAVSGNAYVYDIYHVYGEFNVHFGDDDKYIRHFAIDELTTYKSTKKLEWCDRNSLKYTEVFLEGSLYTGTSTPEPVVSRLCDLTTNYYTYVAAEFYPTVRMVVKDGDTVVFDHVITPSTVSFWSHVQNDYFQQLFWPVAYDTGIPPNMKAISGLPQIGRYGYFQRSDRTDYTFEFTPTSSVYVTGGQYRNGTSYYTRRFTVNEQDPLKKEHGAFTYAYNERRIEV